MSLFDFYEGKVIYIISANSFDAVITWGFKATLRKRFHLSDLEYNANLTEEEIAKLREAKRKLSDLILNKKVILKVYPTNVDEKYLADVYLNPVGIPDAEIALEKTIAGEFVNVKSYLIKKGYLKSWTLS